MADVVAPDGTRITWQRSGTGPALVIAVGAFCDSSTTRGLTELLESDFTVYEYDRRGRGGSGDGPEYSPEQEAQDLAALIGEIDEPGGPFLYGHSSGAIIALEAAAAGVPMRSIAAFEPPFTSVDGRAHDELLHTVHAAVARNDLDAAAVAFLAGSGTPPPVIEGMQRSPVWPRMRAFAPTLVYDLTLSNAGLVPATRYAAIRTGLTVLWGGNSPAWARHAAAAVAAAVPGAATRMVPDQTHAVAHEPVARVLRELFLGEQAVGSALPSHAGGHPGHP